MIKLQVRDQKVDKQIFPKHDRVVSQRPYINQAQLCWDQKREKVKNVRTCKKLCEECNSFNIVCVGLTVKCDQVYVYWRAKTGTFLVCQDFFFETSVCVLTCPNVLQ
jgi:hypothetical protein